MAFFSVGDVVTVRTDLEIDADYYCDGREWYDTFVEGMDDFKGERVTISRISGETCKYEIEEDGGGYYWTDEMFVEYHDRDMISSGGAPMRLTNNFMLGERVVLIKEREDNDLLHIGAVGTVCDIDDSDTGEVGVAWDEDIGGHLCNGHCAKGYGWYVRRSEIELYSANDDINEDDIASNDDILTLIGCG